jgi:4-diphosphocytidyl-2-C-methyl-D-erythritol kinase
MNYKSYAKINLFLDIVSRLKNGYHGIESLFCEIDLYDEIDYEKNHLMKVRVIDESKVLPEENLLKKASDHFIRKLKKIPFGIDFHIKKNIPIGGGLGGGSSNAAAVLKILNNFWETKFTDKTLEKIGSSIGADVPFFIKGGLQQVGGIGDRLKPLNTIGPEIYLLMLMPKISIPTKMAYGLIDRSGLAKNEKRFRLKYSNMIKGFKKSDQNLIISNFYNKFEEVIFSEYDEFLIIKKEIMNSGAKAAFMSGSGSTMFGAFTTKSLLNEGLNRLFQKGYKCRQVMLKFK